MQTKARPDVRDDVYALGVVLVEMLRGQRQARKGTAGPALPGVPPGLADVLRKALAPRKTSRQASATVLLSHLQAFVAADSRGKAAGRTVAKKAARGKGRG